jgi:hypothetical protein
MNWVQISIEVTCDVLIAGRFNERVCTFRLVLKKKIREKHETVRFKDLTSFLIAMISTFHRVDQNTGIML